MIPLYHRVAFDPTTSSSHHTRTPSSTSSSWSNSLSTVLSKPFRRRGGWSQLLFLAVLACTGWVVWDRAGSGKGMGGMRWKDFGSGSFDEEVEGGAGGSSRIPLSPTYPKHLRAPAVREAFLHAWNAYERYAMPEDELLPLSNGSVRMFNSWGVSMYDALDTLYLMGLHTQFNRVVDIIGKGQHAFGKDEEDGWHVFGKVGGGGIEWWGMEEDDHAMFFETTIRYLGGLLSAHALLLKDIEQARIVEELSKEVKLQHESDGIPGEHSRNPEPEHLDRHRRGRMEERRQSTNNRNLNGDALHDKSVRIRDSYHNFSQPLPPEFDPFRSERQAAILLDRAVSLAEKLLPAFYAFEEDGDQNDGDGVIGPLEKEDMKGVELEKGEKERKKRKGMPLFGVNTVTGKPNLGPRHGKVILAEVASCQMEFKYLAYLLAKDQTGDEAESRERLAERRKMAGEYFGVADRVMDYLEEKQLDNGLWYTTWDGRTGEMVDNMVTIGAWSDSAYEYLLKQYLMSGKTETRLKDMYLKSAHAVLQNLLFLSPTREILYVTDAKQGRPSRQLEHLSCFYPGLLALGAATLTDEEFILESGTSYGGYPTKGVAGMGKSGLEDIEQVSGVTEREMHQWAAEGLAYSCWLMYADQPSGLGPEVVKFLRFEGDKKLTERDIDTDLDLGLVADVDVELEAALEEDAKNKHVLGGADSDAKVDVPKADDAMQKVKANLQAMQQKILEAARDGRWIDRVREWAESGDRGEFGKEKPPGVREKARPMPQEENRSKKDYLVKNSKYLLRPETIESIYVMWRTTRDEYWRDRGWAIFLAMEKMCRTPSAYASVLGVNRSGGSRVTWLNEMPSYALAETWKYLYLMFLDHDPLPMDKWVFNTEAHPLPIFEWEEWQRREWGIR